MNWIKNNIVLVVLLLIGVTAVFLSKDYSIHDFGNYYFGAYFLGEGNFNTDLYFPHIFNQNIAQLGYSELYLNYTPNTPLLSVLFYPFTFFSVYTAKILFNLISVLLFSYSLNKWFVKFKIKPQFILLFLLIMMVPIRNGLLFGQVYLLLFFLLSEGYFALQQGKNIKTAIFWSIAICLKVFPIFLLLFLLINKKFKALGYTVLGIFILFLFSLLFVDFEVWKFYLMEVLPKASKGEIYSEFVPHYQSVDEFLKHYFVFHPNYNLSPLFDNYLLYNGLLIGFKSLLILVGFLMAVQERKGMLFQFCYWLFASLLFSSYGSSYSMIIIGFTAIFLLKNNQVLTLRAALYFVLVFLICNLPVSIFIDFQFPFIKTILSLLLLVFLFFREIPFGKFRYVFIAPILISIIALFVVEKPIQDKYISLEKQPGLIYDYEVRDSKLVAKHWGVEGDSEYVFNLNLENQTTEYIELIDNQVYFNNKQLTFTNSNKLKPIRINGNIIIYLSDSERGLGFFNLRKLIVP